MIIRPARTRDARGIARVQVRGWQIGYRGIIPDEYLATFSVDALTNRWLANLAEAERMEHLVAEDEDETIVGWAAFGANQSDLGPDIGELGALYVDTDNWDAGIGGALLEEAEKGLLAKGYGGAILWALDANARTRRFYENRGWRLDGATDTHRSGAGVVRYAKALADVEPEARVDPGDAAP
jgi:GNAT superfamily N-acetyltransferase